jgi:hypothetical protein
MPNVATAWTDFNPVEEIRFEETESCTALRAEAPTDSELDLFDLVLRRAKARKPRFSFQELREMRRNNRPKDRPGLKKAWLDLA